MVANQRTRPIKTKTKQSCCRLHVNSVFGAVCCQWSVQSPTLHMYNTSFLLLFDVSLHVPVQMMCHSERGNVMQKIKQNKWMKTKENLLLSVKLFSTISWKFTQSVPDVNYQRSALNLWKTPMFTSVKILKHVTKYLKLYYMYDGSEGFVPTLYCFYLLNKYIQNKSLTFRLWRLCVCLDRLAYRPQHFQ